MSAPAGKTAATISTLLRDAAAQIKDASDTPELDARILLQTILKKGHAWLIAHGGDPVDESDARRYLAWIQRRAKSEPVAYIIERKEFRTHELKVTPDVLVPRPETELLVERALAHIPASEPLHVSDLGTGSGAIALAIAEERPLCQVTATDTSPKALKVAEQNKARTGLRNITFKQGDWYEALGDQRFSVIVCNPPYVPHSHYQAALTFEPESALFAGDKGLDELQIIISHAPDHLEPAGWLIVEHGYDQADAVQAMFRNAGFELIRTSNDYAGHPRTTEGRLAPTR